MVLIYFVFNLAMYCIFAMYFIHYIITWCALQVPCRPYYACKCLFQWIYAFAILSHHQHMDLLRAQTFVATVLMIVHKTLKVNNTGLMHMNIMLLCVVALPLTVFKVSFTRFYTFAMSL